MILSPILNENKPQVEAVVFSVTAHA